MSRPKPTAAVAFLHGEETAASFTVSLVHLMLHETFRCGVPPYLIANRCATMGLVAGRNRVVQEFLDGVRTEWLLFVDADMGFAADSLERLIAAAHHKDRPIVGGLCFAQKAGPVDPTTNAQSFVCCPTVYAWAETDDRVGFRVLEDYPRDQVVPVSATGAAFLLMHRSALKAMREKDGDSWFTTVVHPQGPTSFSEDMSFCIRAAAAGLPVHVHTGVKTSHDKGGIAWDEAAWDRQCLVEQVVAMEASARPLGPLTESDDEYEASFMPGGKRSSVPA